MIEKKKQIIKLLGGIYPGIYSFGLIGFAQGLPNLSCYQG